MATAQHVDPDSSTRPLVETRKGRAGHSSLAREDDRQPEMTREPQSPAHRWASKVKRPAWGTPVRASDFSCQAAGRQKLCIIHPARKSNCAQIRARG